MDSQNHYDYIDYYYESNSESDSNSDSDSDSDSSTSNASNSVPTRPDDAGSSIWSRRKPSAVMLEGYVDGWDSIEGGSDGGGSLVGRTKSLTDDDLEELKGCLDLGFGFSYDEIPELCSTLPALELCYSMSQRFMDEKRSDGDGGEVGGGGAGGGGGGGGSVASACSSPSRNAIANWKISEPGDDPEEVKARLKYWAQAVACTVKLCNN